MSLIISKKTGKTYVDNRIVRAKDDNESLPPIPHAIKPKTHMAYDIWIENNRDIIDNLFEDLFSCLDSDCVPHHTVKYNTNKIKRNMLRLIYENSSSSRRSYVKHYEEYEC